MQPIPDEVAALLGSYVYVYLDPRNGEPFYIGKGKGPRALAHLDRDSNDEMGNRIAAIRASGQEPVIEILRYGMTDDQAALVEAAAIDLIGKQNLLNKVSGFHKGTYGRIRLQELIDLHRARPVEVEHRAILLTINQLYRSDMPADELEEATRGFWVVKRKRAQRADYAMAVYQGVVREVYRILEWLPAGTLHYEYRDPGPWMNGRRWEFRGEIAGDIRDRYVGHFVGKGGQNPVRYVNC
ncbi:MAG: hypothetical protein D6786_01910 [Gammaproteobacteria bacterium]|nr:MAG: hypothetical protein D6786_01910 [Gammaproteobacteria bacterium]